MTIIISLSGKAGAGKDTVANLIHEQYWCHKVAFAEPIRSMLKTLLHELHAEELIQGFEDRKLKETPQEILCNKSLRVMMQTLGDQWGRQLIHDEIWLKIMQRKIDFAKKQGVEYCIVTDTRYENEFKMLKEQSACMLLIEREGVQEVNQHKSEEGIPRSMFDACIDNSGSISYLDWKVQDTLKRLGVIPDSMKSKEFWEG